jgi:GT2 family glycosyltransferase
MEKKVSVIIVHWNTEEKLRSQLAALGNNEKLHIIVIDNASTIDATWIQTEYPYVTAVLNPQNRGYAFACNQGTIQAIGQWLLFLNPDVLITADHVLNMIQQMSERKLDAASPLPDNTKDYLKPVPSVISLLIEFTPLHKIIPSSVFAKKTLWGGCLLIKKETVLSIGGWDERFFLWFEDSDLTRRLLNNRYQCGFIKVDGLKHSGGESFKLVDDAKKRQIFFHSMDVYSKKYFSYFGQFIIKLLKTKYSKHTLLPVESKGVSLTVPNLKKDLLLEFLQTNYEYLHSTDETVIVTSAVSSDEVWELRKYFSEVRFITIKTNKGFASTVNIGFRVSRSPWTGTVNDDVVFENEWFNKVIVNGNENTGSLNPVIYSDNTTIESAGINVLLKGKAETQTTIKSTDEYESPATNGAAVIYNHVALDRVGLFDERFGSYLEDIDLALRLKRSKYKNLIIPTVKVIHVGHQTAKTVLRRKKAWLDARNWCYVIIKNWSLLQIIQHIPQIVVERMRNLNGIRKAQ